MIDNKSITLFTLTFYLKTPIEYLNLLSAIDFKGMLVLSKNKKEKGNKDSFIYLKVYVSKKESFLRNLLFILYITSK